MRLSSSSKFPPGRFWWNEGAAREYYYIASDSGGIFIANHQGPELSCGRLFILL